MKEGTSMRHLSLKVYVADWCPGCEEAREMARMMSALFPNLQVQIIDIDEPATEIPASVFAIPTYLLNGELLWLGNPRREEAIARIHSLLETGERGTT